MKLKRPKNEQELTTDATTRFLHAMDVIIRGDKLNGGPITTQKAFAESIGHTSSNFTKFADPYNPRNVTLGMCAMLVQLYSINGHWLLTGEGALFYNEGLQTRIEKVEIETENLATRITNLESGN